MTERQTQREGEQERGRREILFKRRRRETKRTSGSRKTSKSAIKRAGEQTWKWGEKRDGRLGGEG